MRCRRNRVDENIAGEIIVCNLNLYRFYSTIYFRQYSNKEDALSTRQLSLLFSLFLFVYLCDMSEQEANEPSALSLVEDYHNDEVRSDGRTASNSNNESEILDFDDDFDSEYDSSEVEESSEEGDAKNEIISGRNWKYVYCTS